VPKELNFSCTAYLLHSHSILKTFSIQLPKILGNPALNNKSRDHYKNEKCFILI
jgi:hypothetical protein